jgi:lipopolysaccharide/colanic/teichoic acid biosynthesis glycosyltransferase
MGDIWIKIPDRNEIKKISFERLCDESFCKTLGSQKVFYRFAKRLVDSAISLLGLVFFFPLWLLLVILIKTDSKGNAIFSHMRVGKNGKLFRLYKFRTMINGVNAEEFAPTSLEDKRVTRVGRFLRRTSLDEMPQLWNVLMGEMSLVGPRPEMQFIVQKYNDMQKKRLIVKPGLTGLWQVFGRKDLPLHENAEYDYFYILNMGFLLDLRILFKTVMVVINGKGAY